MLKKVLQRRSRVTLPPHHLAGAHKRGVTSSGRRAPCYGLARVTARLGAPGLGG